MLGHVSEERWDEQPVGGFYSKAQLRALVAYAAARGIEIMPEIELPGHAQAALAAYPEFGNTGESIDVWDRWGVSYNVFAPTDQTLGFLKDVLREVMDVFPFSFIHIGGDECPKTQWKHSPVAQDRMRAEGLKDEDELQSWFIGQIGRFLADHGRRMVGWDEILEGGLPSGATVMSWRGEAGGIAAARAGHDVIMTPGKPTYFDHYQAEDKETEPIAIGGCNVLESVYAYEPVPSDLTEAEAAHVLGSQFQIWTEYMKTPAKVEYMAFPRACALSEVLWTPREHRDWSGFQARLGHHEARMTEMGVHFRSQHPNPSNRTLR
jgi:hexosaminidase